MNLEKVLFAKTDDKRLKIPLRELATKGLNLPQKDFYAVKFMRKEHFTVNKNNCLLIIKFIFFLIF